MFHKSIVTVITPADSRWRGCQLSLSFAFSIDDIHSELEKRGVSVSFYYNLQLKNPVFFLNISILNLFLNRMFGDEIAAPEMQFPFEDVFGVYYQIHK